MRRTSEAHAELNPEAGGEKVARNYIREFQSLPPSKAASYLMSEKEAGVSRRDFPT